MDEMEEIEEFMQQLDPDIEVIWGTSTDTTLGKDAKVIILASAMAHEMQSDEDSQALAAKDDEYFHKLMHQLYASSKATVRTVVEKELEFEEEPEHKESEQQEPEQEVEEMQPREDPDIEEQPTRIRSFLEKAKEWLMRLTNE